MLEGYISKLRAKRSAAKNFLSEKSVQEKEGHRRNAILRGPAYYSRPRARDTCEARPRLPFGQLAQRILTRSDSRSICFQSSQPDFSSVCDGGSLLANTREQGLSQSRFSTQLAEIVFWLLLGIRFESISVPWRNFRPGENGENCGEQLGKSCDATNMTELTNVLSPKNKSTHHMSSDRAIFLLEISNFSQKKKEKKKDFLRDDLRDLYDKFRSCRSRRTLWLATQRCCLLFPGSSPPLWMRRNVAPSATESNADASHCGGPERTHVSRFCHGIR